MYHPSIDPSSTWGLFTEMSQLGLYNCTVLVQMEVLIIIPHSCGLVVPGHQQPRCTTELLVGLCDNLCSPCLQTLKKKTDTEGANDFLWKYNY